MLNTLVGTEPITDNGWKLLDDQGKPVLVNQATKDFRGADIIINGGSRPHKGGSTGHIYTNRGHFYPSVCNLHWVAP